ncbi:adenylosuccinate lyase [Microbacterium suwonense]|uniref:Adenylosuccinate lyase n=1 Tax=Microbacterium suwonense TaxID=683047 RepID=A0ABM8FWZ2_9MICO|nr:adenylosuccinate lyase [Microbacterium suwonense]
MRPPRAASSRSSNRLCAPPYNAPRDAAPRSGGSPLTSLPSLPSQPLSPLDGRYRAAVTGLADFLSEAGLNRARVEVEVEWLIALTDRSLFGTSPLSDADKQRLRGLYRDFGQTEIDWLAEKEAVTRHDVKAVEYLVRDRLATLGLDAIAELTHFACTSEDINSASYALTVKRAVEGVWLPALDAVIAKLRELAVEHADAAMLSRTHGQPATPSTMGKELAVFAWRLERVRGRIAASEYLAKFSGATGTWSAHLAADPDVDWPAVSREYIEGLGIDFNPLTTQIESHDWQVELYDHVRHAGGILHNLATDVWTYISLGYFAQIPVAGATGSSTMPHKINPIRFENAEANLELSGALLNSLSQTLVTSRMQRDLTDSTTQRNIGVAFGHSLLALDNLHRGLDAISLSREVLLDDLDHNWEVLAEAIQTVIRAEVVAGRSTITDPYALLKDLTRGHRVGAAELAEFVQELEIGDAAKQRLLALTPATYTGLAEGLAK